MDWMRNATVFFLVIPFILLLVYRKKLGRTTLVFTLAMATMSCVNIISVIARWTDFNYDTTYFFVIGVNFLSFLLFLIYFYLLLKLEWIKRIQLLLIAIFVSVFILMGIIQGQNFFLKFPSYFYLVETLILLVSITLFFYETFNSDIILNIKDYFPFWVSLSLIIIYVGLLPLLFFLQSVNYSLSLNVYIIILFFINLIGYGILSYGVFRSKKVSNMYYDI